MTAVADELLRGPLRAAATATAAGGLSGQHSDDPVEHLLRALDHHFTLPHHDIRLDTHQNQLVLTIEAAVDGYMHIPQVAALLDHHDRHLLPGMLALIEERTHGYLPMCGPRGAQAYADYSWNDEWMEEELVNAGHLSDFGQLSQQRLYALARQHGLNYQGRIRDEYGARFFKVKYSAEQTLARLGRLARQIEGRTPGRLTQLHFHLSALHAVPQPEVAAHLSELVGCHPIVTLFNARAEPHCGAWEALDEYFQLYQQMGEREPCHAVSLEGQHLPDTLTYLRHLSQVNATALAVRDELDALNSEL